MAKSTKSTHTHKGNCQACGRLQAVDNATGNLAKHGYNVEHGYFRGTCPGSGEYPLQIERALTDEIIASMEAEARAATVLLKKLQAGKAHPAMVQKFEDSGRRTVLKDKKTGNWDVVMIPWAEANKYAQAAGMDAAIFETESNIRFCEAHAHDMTALAARIHGTELPLSLQEKPAKAPEAMVDVKAAKVTGTFQTKAARKAELDKINRLFEVQTRKLQAIFLAIPHDDRTQEQMEVYYTPMYPHEWKAKHSAAALHVFPQAAEIVKEIEQLVKAREAVKNAP